MAECTDCDKKCDSHEVQLLKINDLETKFSLVGWVASLLLGFLIIFVVYTFVEFSSYREKANDQNIVFQKELTSVTVQMSSVKENTTETKKMLTTLIRRTSKEEYGDDD